ncbi:MAG: M23 family metallopeptidase, partial [Chloroflexota bacterium]
YYKPLWGSPYQILPDSLFVNGPAQIGFDTQAFVDSRPGWLKTYKAYVADANRSGANIIEYIAHYYSVSPRLLLALLEYQSGALSRPAAPLGREEYVLGYEAVNRKGLFLQLTWAANQLNDGYYKARTLQLDLLEHPDGTIERVDPWQNAATISLMRFFNQLEEAGGYRRAISPDGLAAVYRGLFGDPWADPQPHLPGSLEQPFFLLPFEPGDVWALTGGPHTGWGSGEPLAALDFAPPSKTQGCAISDRWVTAVADGVVVRSGVGELMLDLDGDGDERTGWNVFYLHLATEDRATLGTVLKAGEPLGHPSCEGGSATGTHVHIARKYNGEWLPAAGIGGGMLAFNLEGWWARNGALPYQGTLQRNSQVIVAVTNANSRSFIHTDRQAPEPAPTAEPAEKP